MAANNMQMQLDTVRSSLLSNIHGLESEWSSILGICGSRSAGLQVVGARNDACAAAAPTALAFQIRAQALEDAIAATDRYREQERKIQDNISEASREFVR